MSQENVEIVRQALDAYVRRDEAAMRELTDANVELDWSRSMGWLADVYKGIDETMRFYAGYFEAFSEIVFKPGCFIHTDDLVIVPNDAQQVDVEELVDLGDRVTFVVFVQKGHPAGSDGEVRDRMAAVTEWVEHLITRMKMYTDIDEARAAAERLAKERG
jgi:ketosteroid isomerase-like protein